MRKQLSGIGKAFGIVWDADKIYPYLLLMRALADNVRKYESVFGPITEPEPNATPAYMNIPPAEA